MHKSYVIGIDIGTQGTKGTCFSGSGEKISEAFISSRLIKPGPGMVEEDPEDQVDSVCGVIRRCVKEGSVDPKDVHGIAIDGQMAGIIGIGEDGRHVTPYDSWLDAVRCGPWISVMNEKAGNKILERTGGPPSINHGPKILYWMNEQQGIFSKIRSFVQPGGYAAMRLCGLPGEKAFIDTTYLHFSGFADNRKKEWDRELCGIFGLDRGLLPEIVEPTDIIGEVVSEMAEKAGIIPGIPVVAGCGDTAASFLSCGAVEEGICIDVAGTASVFATTTSSLKPDAEKVLGCGHAAEPDLWHPYAYINGGGMNLEWYRKDIAGALRGKPDDAPGFDDLNLEAGKITPEETNPLFIPHLGGRVCPSMPDLRGAWLNLNWHHTPAHLFRAVLEGVALEYGIYMRTLKRLYPSFTPSEIRITGGGENSGVWNRMKADSLGIPVVKLSRNEGAPLGSAIIAGTGTGLFKSIRETADEWIKTAERIEPDHNMYNFYQKRISMFADYIDAVNAVSKK